MRDHADGYTEILACDMLSECEKRSIRGCQHIKPATSADRVHDLNMENSVKVIGVLIGAVVLLVLAALAADALAQSASGDIKARINARPLDDGRLEFAFQLESQTDDLMEEEENTPTEWDDRLLPRGRNFPSEPSIGTWLSSRPSILVGEVETRIRARRHEDGRTEFALQQKLDGENWGENILPSGRFLSAEHRTSHIDRWLNSSPVTLSTVTVVPAVEVPAGVPIVAEAVLAWAELDGQSWNGSEQSFYFDVFQDPLDDAYYTGIVKRARTDHRTYGTLRLQVSCYSGVFAVTFWENNLPYQASNRSVRVSYRFDEGEVFTESWSHSSGNEDSFYPPDSTDFARRMRGSTSLVVRATFNSDTITAIFTNVGQMLLTRVQPNIEYCGHY